MHGEISPAVLRLEDLCRYTGKGRTAIYEGVKSRDFPAPIRLGVRAVGWLKSDVDQWLADRAAVRASQATE